ncbi:unnamed protein product [Anisakis simplex]|uniref:UDENN domain-containing protein n=1 Tax=Anisakis simplex TaxID=6269 RepID=A0A3P6QP44_ANISI|nr:unnamed protein product [Anisakis simplex]
MKKNDEYVFQVEFSYPPLNDSTGEIPNAWQNLPSLALPDGAHNVDQDVIYFLLPSLENPNRAVFGISCYRQISAEDLLNKSRDVTRSTVQKSVCVLTRVPLFGILTAKLQLITQVYFNERDFAKVEVLSQMYNNLCEMFMPEAIDEQAAVMDIPIHMLVESFKHRLLALFKLILLERKVVFYIFPVRKLGEIMIALISLFPKQLEEGLFQAAAYSKLHCVTTQSESISEDDIELNIESTENDDRNEESSQQSSAKLTNDDDLSKRDDKSSSSTEIASEAIHEQKTSSANQDSTLNTSNADSFELNTDSYGFPLNIFTKGSLFHPYLSISYLDMIRSDNIRAYVIGSTNALFVQRKDNIDVIVTVSDVHLWVKLVSDGGVSEEVMAVELKIKDDGEGDIEIVNTELRRAMSLTAADLRFADFIIKEVDGNARSANWEGGDEWIKLQMRAYLLSLMATVKCDLKESLSDFNEVFINEWKLTNNYRIWSSGHYADLSSAVPGHPFCGGLGVSDVLLRVEHSIGSSEGGRRVVSAVASTGKLFTDTGLKVKSSISSWFKGANSNNSHNNDDNHNNNNTSPS